ncbi:MAG: tRNA dimethylallyltransferase [Candidatus Woesebacteria bacterium GW2011_GWC1_38_13]|uniref:tRNA dimethylallyltransferase n=1 Tax=Candidatus Woesebacteria bacterium GW2011_GWC1_38_13 TaxID=1618583 RepID=A0A0G0LUW7_9BACT|nr:MAG: tRNA dimethylallyltransferase [Candidatus Woesebacteria bacterium GW2011_GWC1_38_13]
MKKKLLVICGQTATGKTLLGIDLAKKFGGEIISADSRQVYKKLDIGTGKTERNTRYVIRKTKLGMLYVPNNSTRIWCYDLVEPAENFSVSQYFDAARDTISVKPDGSLRKELSRKSISELYEILVKVDPQKAGVLNESDRKNSRRLVRAIEIAKKVSSIKYQVSSKKEDNRNEYPAIDNGNNGLNYDSLLMVALKAEKILIDERIEKRVLQRLEMGFEDEIKKLLKTGIDWKYGSMSSTGYHQYEDLYKGNIDKDEFIRRWIAAEQKYAKRQMVWFKKDKRINWFDVSKKDYFEDVEKLVESWYYEGGSIKR